jgi:hypothetical protein
MPQNVQQHHLCMAVADVFSSLICIRQIKPLIWNARWRSTSLNKKIKLLKQRFEVVLLTIDSVK